MVNDLIKSVEAEFRRYKALAEGALNQASDDKLSAPGPSGGNSLAIICWHISGNLKSRFTDFLESDGEKPWRGREEEFSARSVTRAELMEKWNDGWNVLFATLDSLSDEDLTRTVKIRAQDLRVHDALNRSLAHISYHVGQIVYVAHAFASDAWTYLSIPPGQSAAYNANPTFDKPRDHAAQAQPKQ
jgi:uncharacterized damage-inducible protein DinB